MISPKVAASEQKKGGPRPSLRFPEQTSLPLRILEPFSGARLTIFLPFLDP